MASTSVAARSSPVCPDGSVVCDVCHVSLARKADLPRHKRLHETEKEKLMHRCPFDGCKYRNLQKSNVDTHVRIHTGAKNRRCPDCDFATTDPGSLTRHRKRAHGYEPKPRRRRLGGVKLVNGDASSGKVLTSKSSARHSPYSRESSADYSDSSSPSDGEMNLIILEQKIELGMKPAVAANVAVSLQDSPTEMFPGQLSPNGLGYLDDDFMYAWYNLSNQWPTVCATSNIPTTCSPSLPDLTWPSSSRHLLPATDVAANTLQGSEVSSNTWSDLTDYSFLAMTSEQGNSRNSWSAALSTPHVPINFNEWDWSSILMQSAIPAPPPIVGDIPQFPTMDSSVMLPEAPYPSDYVPDNLGMYSHLLGHPVAPPPGDFVPQVPEMEEQFNIPVANASTVPAKEPLIDVLDINWGAINGPNPDQFGLTDLPLSLPFPPSTVSTCPSFDTSLSWSPTSVSSSPIPSPVYPALPLLDPSLIPIKSDSDMVNEEDIQNMFEAFTNVSP